LGITLRPDSAFIAIDQETDNHIVHFIELREKLLLLWSHAKQPSLLGMGESAWHGGNLIDRCYVGSFGIKSDLPATGHRSTNQPLDQPRPGGAFCCRFVE